MTGPMINPKKPKSLKPTNRAMSVANGSSPILDESTFGSDDLSLDNHDDV